MAEAFAIIGLASNIAQFIGYGIQIVSTGNEVYKSSKGVGQETKELHMIVDNIQNLSQEVENNKALRLSKDGLAIRNFAAECTTLATELSVVLKTLRVRDNAGSRTVESGRVAIRSVLPRNNVTKLKNRLQDLEGRLRTRIAKVLEEFVFPIH
jgi:hypothetical protein